MTAARMIYPLTPRRRHRAFKPRQLMHETLAVQEPRATGGEQWKRICIDRAAILLAVLVTDAVPGECLHQTAPWRLSNSGRGLRLTAFNDGGQALMMGGQRAEL